MYHSLCVSAVSLKHETTFFFVREALRGPREVERFQFVVAVVSLPEKQCGTCRSGYFV